MNTTRKENAIAAQAGTGMALLFISAPDGAPMQPLNWVLLGLGLLLLARAAWRSL